MTIPNGGANEIWREGDGPHRPTKSVSANQNPIARRVILQITRRAMDGFQAKRIIDDWIGFYNSERPHTALDKRMPDTAYFCQTEIRKAA